MCVCVFVYVHACMYVCVCACASAHAPPNLVLVAKGHYPGMQLGNLTGGGASYGVMVRGGRREMVPKNGA